MSESKSDYTPLPKTREGHVDVGLLEKMYMEGPDISWDLFCKRHGFHSRDARNNCPVAGWRRAKRERVALERSEELSDLFFDRKYDWSKEVSKTLTEYPKAIDKLFMLLQGRINDWTKAYIQSAQGGGAGAFNRISTFDMSRMADAMAKLQTAKYKSLLLHEFTVKMADQEQERELKNVGEKQKPFQVEIMNRGILTNKDLEDIYDKWLDKPTKAPNDKND